MEDDYRTNTSQSGFLGVTANLAAFQHVFSTLFLAAFVACYSNEVLSFVLFYLCFLTGFDDDGDGEAARS